MQLPVIDSTDQQYLYDIAVAAPSSHCPPDVANRSPGKLNHAFKTLPSNNFLILVNYAAKVYVPMWFDIKSKTAITEGNRHLDELIQKNHFLKAKSRKLIDVVMLLCTTFLHFFQLASCYTG